MSRGINRLTALAVKNAKPEEGKPKRLSDGNGLYLLVTQGKNEVLKHWRMDYYRPTDKKRDTLAFGVFPDVSLEEARQKRDQARKHIASGQDPKQVKRRERYERMLESASTFAAITAEYHQLQSPRWSERHAGEWLKSLEVDALPFLGAIPVNEISAPMILDVVRRIEARGAHEISRRVLQRITAIIQYAVITGRTQFNPAAGMVKALAPKQATEGFAMIPVEELGEMASNIRTYDGHIITRTALEFTLLTASRTSETRLAKWEQFNFDTMLWSIPAEQMKMKRPHIVPLSSQVVKLLDNLKAYTGQSPFLFPDQNAKGRVMSLNTMIYALYRMGYHKRATVHGFRKAFSTILHTSGAWRSEAIEAAIAHKDTNKMRAIYNQSNYLEERRAMMQWWADYIDQITQNPC